MYAPICLFVYNRLWETQNTLGALKSNTIAKESDMYIFCDGAKDEKALGEVQEVRDFVRKVVGFKSVTIFESKENKGLATSIISGASQVLGKHGKVIVMEDDLVTLPTFLEFMNGALEFYKDDKNIQSVNGFSIYLKDSASPGSVYFQRRPFSWGWATWLDRWDSRIFDKERLREEIKSDQAMLGDFEKECGDDIVKMFLDSIYERNNSWYVRWAFDHFRNRTYSVYPSFSLVENIGFGESGTHCKGINSYQYKLDELGRLGFVFNEFVEPNERATNAFLRNFSFSHKLIVRLKLLKSISGWRQLISEIQMRFS